MSTEVDESIKRFSTCSFFTACSLKWCSLLILQGKACKLNGKPASWGYSSAYCSSQKSFYQLSVTILLPEHSSNLPLLQPGAKKIRLFMHGVCHHTVVVAYGCSLRDFHKFPYDIGSLFQKCPESLLNSLSRFPLTVTSDFHVSSCFTQTGYPVQTPSIEHINQCWCRRVLACSCLQDAKGSKMQQAGSDVKWSIGNDIL